VNVPPSVRKNGTLHVHAFIMPAKTEMLNNTEWNVMASALLTKLAVPEAATFQLVGESESSGEVCPPTFEIISYYLMIVFNTVQSISFFPT
jgi:hypothetical protein